MSRQTFIIAFPSDKKQVIDLIQKLPWNSCVELKLPKRSIPQNDKLWAMLTEVSNQLLWKDLLGRPIKLSTDDWKLMFMNSLNRELRNVPNLDGNGFVNLGTKSSELTKEEMMALITIIEAFGAQNGVIFKDERNAA